MQTLLTSAAPAPLAGRILASLQTAAGALRALALPLRRWRAAQVQAAADRRALASMNAYELRDLGIDSPVAHDPYSRPLPDFRIQP